jgi:hypothetical protein
VAHRRGQRTANYCGETGVEDKGILAILKIIGWKNKKMTWMKKLQPDDIEGIRQFVMASGRNCNGC